MFPKYNFKCHDRENHRKKTYCSYLHFVEATCDLCSRRSGDHFWWRDHYIFIFDWQNGQVLIHF